MNTKKLSSTLVRNLNPIIRSKINTQFSYFNSSNFNNFRNHMFYNYSSKSFNEVVVDKKDEKIFKPKQNGRSYEEDVEYYEKEFNKVYEKVKAENDQIINKVISEEEKECLNFLVEEIKVLKGNEKLLFSIFTKQVMKSLHGIDITKHKLSWPAHTKNKNVVSYWPPENPNWNKFDFDPYSGSTGSSSKPIASNQATTEAATEKVEEKPKEKQVYDVKLVSFDASKKITVIKEVRALFNLGLKESKELVEQAPVIIAQKLKPDEIEPIKEKLKDLAVIELE